jgi:hypothetical protein
MVQSWSNGLASVHAKKRSSVPRLSRSLGGPPERPLAPEDAARRVAAFVYGNILVLAALVALDPDDLYGPKAVAYVVGTGLSTFVAHVIAESIGFQIRTKQPILGEVVRRELRDSVPILSATIIPALLTGAALLGWLAPGTALPLAIGVTVIRLAALG